MATLTREQTTSASTASLAVTHALGKRDRWIDVAVVTLACCVFFALCVYQLQLPGLYNDEAFDVIPSMQMLLGHPVELQRNAGLHIFNLALPLMSSSDYQGVTSTYLAIPFLAIGGINVISLRMMTVCVGLLGVVLAYFLARAWFGKAEARLTVLMLATSPAWVFWSRIGVYVVSEVVPIMSGALLALTYWLRHRPLGAHNRTLYMGMFLLGLGLTTKLLFLWAIIAVVLCGLILFGRVLWESKNAWLKQWGLWLRVAFFSGVAFCSGALPFLLYNLMTRGTFHLLSGTVGNLSSTSNGVNNTAFLRNLWTEADSFKVVLDGGYFWFQGVAAHTYSNPLTPTLFGVAAVGLMALVLPRWSRHEHTTATQLTGLTLLAMGVLLSGLLAIAGSARTWPSFMLLGAIALGCVGVLLLSVSAFRGGSYALAEWVLLTAGAITGAVWWFGGSGRPETAAPGGPLGLWPVDAAGVLFWVSGAGLAVLLGWDRRASKAVRATLATLVLIGLIVAQSAVTVSGLWGTHLVVLLPLPQMLIAAFVVAVGRRAVRAVRTEGNRRLRGALRVAPAVVIVASIVVADLLVDYSYQHDLAVEGGRSTFSDAIYSLSSYLEGLPARPQVVAMDWGFKRPIQFLTSERVNPLEAYGYSAQPTPDFYNGLRDLLKDPNTIYLFHVDEETAYPRFDAFTHEAAAEGKTVSLDKTFTIRDGAIVYRLYSAR